MQANILGADVTYKLGAPGRHLVMQFAGGAGGGGARRRRSCARGAGAWRSSQPAAGRGARMTLDLPGGAGAAHRRKLQRQSGIDAGRARAARAGRRRPARPPHRRAGRHAGTRSARRRRCIAALAEPSWPARHRPGLLLRAADAGAVGGSSLRAAGAAMPETSAALEPQVLAAVRRATRSWSRAPLGSRMGPIVKALERSRYSPGRPLAASSQG